MPSLRLPRPSPALRWTPRGVRLIVALNLVVLVLASAPFLLWEGLGPERFSQLSLAAPGQDLDGAGAPGTSTLASGSHSTWPDELPFDLSPTTRVTLVFSVGSRGMDAERARDLRVGGFETRGSDGLTDTIMLLVADRATGQVALLSIPRDLWMDERGHRINATRNLHGMQAFVDDVAQVTGLPVHHAVQVNFAAFAELVDTIGGIPVEVDRPLADLNAHLYVPAAGCWLLDGADALAWARSRSTLTRTGDGRWATDATASDFGRIDRQQQLLRLAWDRVRSPRTLRSLPELLLTVRRGLVVDDGLGVQEVRDLLTAFQHVPAGTVEGHVLPTIGRRIGSAAAQILDADEATALLTRLRTWPPETEADAAPETAAPRTPGPTDPSPRPTRSDPTTEPGAAPACDDQSARSLPDPTEPLARIRAARSRAGADDERPTGTERPTDDATPADPTPSPGATDTPPPAGPSDDPSPPPSETPSPDPDPTEDDGLLPWPV